MIELSKKIKEFREENNIGLRELSKLTGVTISTISRIENGKCSPKYVTLEKLNKVIKNLL